MGKTIEGRLQEAFGRHVRSEGPPRARRRRVQDPRNRPHQAAGAESGKRPSRRPEPLPHHDRRRSGPGCLLRGAFRAIRQPLGRAIAASEQLQAPSATPGTTSPNFCRPEERPSTRVNGAFPDELRCLPGADSPAVFVVTNVRDLTDEERQAGPRLLPATTWHTDIEHHAIPLHVSMFLVHKAPVARDAPGGTWVPEWVPGPDDSQTDRYFEDSDPELLRLRRSLPLNGETSFADTAAAFAALPGAEQSRLSKVRVRRHSYTRNDGANLAPLVRTNPRSGTRSLHSPLWCPRPPTQIPLEIEGMSEETSRAFLEEIEGPRAAAGVPLRPRAHPRRRDAMGPLHDPARRTAVQGQHPVA